MKTSLFNNISFRANIEDFDYKTKPGTLIRKEPSPCEGKLDINEGDIIVFTDDYGNPETVKATKIDYKPSSGNFDSERVDIHYKKVVKENDKYVLKEDKKNISSSSRSEFFTVEEYYSELNNKLNKVFDQSETIKKLDQVI